MLVKINWLEAAGNYVQVHARGGEYLLRETMGSLDPKRPVRIYRGAIVNLDRLTKNRSMANGDLDVTLAVIADDAELCGQVMVKVGCGVSRRAGLGPLGVAAGGGDAAERRTLGCVFNGWILTSGFDIADVFMKVEVWLLLVIGFVIEDEPDQS